MTATVCAETFTFPKQLNLDRGQGVYTFKETSDTVLVVNAQEEVSLEELELLFHPYELREISNLLELFDQ
jgi:hypothetical protein